MNRRKNQTMLAVVLCTIGIAACGGGGSGNGDGDNTTSPAPGGDATVEKVPGIDGTWTRDCGATDSTNALYTSAILVVSENTMTLTESHFDEITCTTPADIETTVTESSLLVTGNMQPTDDGEAHHVDVTVESKTEDGVSVEDAVNVTRYDIVFVRDTDGNDVLLFGLISDPLNGSTAALRPEALEETVVYMR